MFHRRSFHPTERGWGKCWENILEQQCAKWSRSSCGSLRTFQGAMINTALMILLRHYLPFKLSFKKVQWSFLLAAQYMIPQQCECQSWYFLLNTCYVCIRSGSTWKISLPSLPLCCEFKTALKIH